LQVDKIFKVQHTDPWLLGDKHRTSRTIQVCCIEHTYVCVCLCVCMCARSVRSM